MRLLPPYQRFELESSGLQYNMYCSYTLAPPRGLGIAGDLFIVAQPSLVFYKENTTADRRGKWRLAPDERLIHHPFEFAHRLVVTSEKFIQWSQHRPKEAKFEDAIPHMAALILAPFRGEAHDNPIDIDDN